MALHSVRSTKEDGAPKAIRAVFVPYRICDAITGAATAGTTMILTEVVHLLAGAILGSHTYTAIAS